MRIVHLVSDLSRAGTQRQVMIVARRQAALGHRVTILVAGPTYELGPEMDAAGLRWMAIPQVSHVRLPLKLGGVINYALILFTLLRLRPQIVHSHGFLTHHRRLAMTARRLTGVRLVHKEVNVPGCFPEHYRAVAAELAARTGCIVANCRAVRDALVAELGYDPAKIQVVYNALDMEGYRLVEAPVGEPTVGIIGRFDPEKRHEDFLEAAALVAAEHPTVRFLIFGREEGATAVRGREAFVRQRAEELGIAERVEFRGPFTPAELPEVMAAISVYTQPSEFEGLPNAVMEAMLYGRPCVVTEAGGMPELVGNGGVGIVTPVRDPKALAAAWMRLLADAELRRRLGEAAHKRVVKLCAPEAVVGTLDLIYRRLLTGREDVT